jgi:hypothetical protein
MKNQQISCFFINSFDSLLHLKVERFSDMTYLISAVTEYSNIQYRNVKSNNASKIVMQVIGKYLHYGNIGCGVFNGGIQN